MVTLAAGCLTAMQELTVPQREATLKRTRSVGRRESAAGCLCRPQKIDMNLWGWAKTYCYHREFIHSPFCWVSMVPWVLTHSRHSRHNRHSRHSHIILSGRMQGLWGRLDLHISGVSQAMEVSLGKSSNQWGIYRSYPPVVQQSENGPFL